MLNIKKNVLLAKHTTFKIGGPARYFCIAENKEDLIKAIKKAKELRQPFFILGKGSNVLALDEGFNGLIIKIQNPKSKIQNSKVYAEAGVKLEDIVKLSAREGLAGLEWAAGIPGTIGGAIYGNAQAFDNKMSEIVKSVEVFDATEMRIKHISKKQCSFSDKDSIFKRNKNLIIVSAILKLKKGNRKEIQNKIKENLNQRKKRHPLNYSSAGSVFVNQEGRPPSAYLIEQAGLKGLRIGKAEVSKKHAGFIINLGGAKAEDVLELIKIIKKEVKNKFGINLEEEIQIIK